MSSTNGMRSLVRMAETNAPRIVVGLTTMTAVALVFVSLRFYCKMRYHKKIQLDDYVIGAAWINLFIFATLSVWSTRFGIGQHINTIPFDTRLVGLKLLYIGRIFGLIALAVSKTSFAITLLNLAMHKWQRVIIWFIMVTVNVTLGMTALSLLIQCSPIEKAWDLGVSGSCWPSNIQITIGIAASAYSAGMDFALALFPTFMIWKLKMEWREKLGVIMAMSLGVLAGITAIIKTFFIPGTSRSADFTFTTTDLLIWSGAESAVTIIATSIPFLRLLVKEVVMKFRKPTLDVDYLGDKSFRSTQTGQSLRKGNLTISKPIPIKRPGSDSGDDAHSVAGSNVEKRARVVFEGGRARVEFRDNWDAEENWK